MTVSQNVKKGHKEARQNFIKLTRKGYMEEIQKVLLG